MRTILYVCRYEFLWGLAIHKGAGDWHSLPYAHQHHGGVNAHNVTTFRWSVCWESIGEHRGAVMGISAMSTVSDPRPASTHPDPNLLIVRSETVFGGCLHSGLPLVSDGY